MKVVVLASGSKENCTYIEKDGIKILFDLGLSYKQLRLRLEQINVDVTKTDAVFITHEHTDHVAGVRTFNNNVSPKFYLTKGTLEGLNNCFKESMTQKDYQLIDKFETVNIGSLKITAIPIHHDCKEPVGFIIEDEKSKVVYLTDSGYIDEKLHEYLYDATMFILESNYDPEMLFDSSRPHHLKTRILCDKGHMSNEDSMITLAKVIGPNTKIVMHAHISDSCNTFDIIEKTRNRIFKEYNVKSSHVKFICAQRFITTGVYEL